MRLHEFKIPTKRCVWTVVLDHGFVFFYSLRRGEHVSELQGEHCLAVRGTTLRLCGVPKSILTRAKVFLEDPDRFGVVRYDPTL